MEVCPTGVIKVEGKKVRIGEGCVECRTCLKVCPQTVFTADAPDGKTPVCSACPIACRIPEGSYGACMRYYNEGGVIGRKARVHSYAEVADIVEAANASALGPPLLTGIGSGTTYPDFRPSPFIVSGVRDGIDIITVVTEAPLSYGGVKVKLDTDRFLGEESKGIYIKRKGKRRIGHLCTEEYGSKMLSLGGVNTLTSKDGMFAAKAIFELLQGKWVSMEVEDGAKVEIALHEPPKIDGIFEERMRPGCGSAVSGLFAPYMAAAADEVIVLDGHITGLFSEHPAGRESGKARSGVSITGQKSTDGRYFLAKGAGWGGTAINEPLDVIAEIDAKKMRDGSTILITETTGRKSAFYRMKGGRPVQAPPSPAAKAFLAVLADSCEPSRASAVFAAGVGGSARAGVTKNPVRLTRAVHEGRVAITIGGARPFIFPGGGINFLVDVEKIKYGSIYLSPTPSFVLPVEYTMRKDTFAEIGGHVDAIRPIESVINDPAVSAGSFRVGGGSPGNARRGGGL